MFDVFLEIQSLECTKLGSCKVPLYFFISSSSEILFWDSFVSRYPKGMNIVPSAFVEELE